MKRSMYAVLLPALFLAPSCADRSSAPTPSSAWASVAPSPPSPPRPVSETRETVGYTNARGSDAPLVIVTIDGVRWQEIFEGTEPARSGTPRIRASTLLPNLYNFGIEHGAFLGAPGHGTVAASGPDFVSLPGYTEIFGGRAHHACVDNGCDRTIVPTLLDDAHASGAKVAAFTTWTKLDFALTATPGTFPVSSGPRGTSAVAGRGDLDAERADAETATRALAYLVEEKPDVLYIGLGETDTYAHNGNYPGYVEALRHADDVLGRLGRILDRDARGRRTNVIVTADHGRAADFRNHGGVAPESARVWMVASGPSITARGFVTSPELRHLADLAPTARVLLGLAPPPPAENDDGRGRVLDELFAAERPSIAEGAHAAL